MSRTIGSSDVPKVLGLSPWGSPWEVWARLQGLTEYDSAGSPATRRGNMLEASLLKRYSSELGVQVVPGPPLGTPGVQGPEPWMHARPDGYATDGEGTAWLVECKTSRYLDEVDGWGDHGTGDIPRHYLAQVVWQLMCTGADRCDVVAFGTVRDDWRVYVVRRHQALEDAIRKSVTAWHQRHIVEGELPSIDGTDPCRQALALAWPARAGGRPDRPADASDLQLLEELRQVRDLQDELWSRRRQLETTLQARMAEAGRIVDDEGAPLVRWSDRKGSKSIDVDELRRRHPELAAQLTKPGKAGRTFTLIRSKR